MRVVGFHTDEGDIDRRFFREMLRLGQMQGARPRRECFRPLVMSDAQPVLLDFLDMLRPRIDEGHILTGLRDVRAGIAADRPGADDDDSLAHGSLPTAVLDGILAAAGVCRQRATLYSGVAAKAGTQPSTTRKLTSGSRLSPGRRAKFSTARTTVVAVLAPP